MKSAFSIVCLSFITLLANAQHVFFVEANGEIETIVKQKLVEAKQNIINTIVGSDYILKTSFATLSPNQFTLKVSVIDSLTFKPVIEDNESYLLKRPQKNMQAALRLAFEAMMEKNLSRIGEVMEMNRLQPREVKLYKNKS
jgi:hypothetical protein